MTTFKLSKRVQIILATLLVLVLGIIITCAWTNDKAMASVTCTYCRTEVTSFESKDEEYHGYKCHDCSNWYSVEKHNYVNGKCAVCQHEYTSVSVPTTCCGDGEFLIIVKKTHSNHTWGCSACGQNGYTEEHNLDSLGFCLDCGEIPNDDGEQSEGDGETEQCNHKYKENFIDFVYTGSGWHDYYKYCTICEMMIRQGAEECNQNATNGKCSLCTESGKAGCAHTETKRICYALYGDYHAFYDVCTNVECGNKEVKWDEACSDTDDDGICDKCKEKLGKDATGTSSGVGSTECKHYYTINKDDKQHWEECAKCGIKKDGTIETHTLTYKDNEDGTHNSKCTKCEYELKNEAHKYENRKCVCGAEEVVTEEKLEVSSEKYTIKDSYIAKVSSGTTMSQFRTNIQHNATEIKIYTKNNVWVESENTKMATGMKIELKKGDETKTFTIVVTGDVNGDTEVELKDFFAINKYRLNKTNLTKEYLLAGDVDFDGNVDRDDMLQINKFRLGKINIL